MISRAKSALAIGTGMMLAAGLGVGYVVTSGGLNSEPERVSTVSSIETKAAAANPNACGAVALTFFADTAAPSVISNVFPVGTKLKITNLDNNKSTTVPVTGVSGSCALLNTAAMDQIREAGKNVVRRNTVEVVQAGAAPAAPGGAAPAAPAGGGACNGVALTFSAEGGAPGVTSNVFPVGTKLKIANLDNGKSTTVPVTGVSGSCALLNTAAMDQIREAGKNVVRRNTVEVVQAGKPAAPANPANPAQPAAPATSAAPAPAGGGACNGVALTFFADTAAPAVSSNVFPVGTRLKITNLDNGKATTVPVTGVSGSCALLNSAAMDQIREPGKNVVRRNTVQRLN